MFQVFLIDFAAEGILLRVESCFAMAILDLISHVHLATFVIMLPKQLTFSTFSHIVWLFFICYDMQ
jgi:hypothetical protein